MSTKKITRPLHGRYRKLLTDIGSTLARARSNAIVSVNRELVKANWEIGRHIVEFEQRGKIKAEYGSELLDRLSRDLKLKFGNGFSRRNVLDMRRFYLSFPIWQALPAKLSWTHYVSLLSISDVAAREFYLRQTVNEGWSSRALERQVSSSLYERYVLSSDKRGVMRQQRKRNIVKSPQQVVKDPYVFDFLEIKGKVSERALEQRIIDKLQLFLLELGKGFTFVARQFRFSVRNKHFYVDLVFYHRILKCFVLIDLKTRQASHADVGQMNLYLNYFKAEENVENDNEPIGIILSTDKDEVLVDFAMGGLSNKIFVSKYQLYLPDKKLLKNEVKTVIENKKGNQLKALKQGKNDSN